MAKIAEELIKSLCAMGVRYAFGIPGGPSIPYMEAMRNNGIDYIYQLENLQVKIIYLWL